MSISALKNQIDQAMGREPADVVIKNVKILNVLTGDISAGDIAICGERIIGTHYSYKGKTEIDGSLLYAVPGFIDTHVHIESSLVTPHEFEKMVLPNGTTTIIADPHEMGNVLGTAAFDYFMNCRESLLVDMQLGLSSCVPSTPIGTSGARIDAKDIRSFAQAADTHLAEVMDIAAVLNVNPDMLEKLEIFGNRHIDGHMPGVGMVPDRDRPILNALASAGIKTDHECSTIEEAREKMKRGIRILIREGTAAKNLEALIPLVNDKTAPLMAFCTDDYHPADIAENGHINHLIARSIGMYDELIHGDEHGYITNIYRMASYSGADIFNLNRVARPRGEISPGYQADIVLLKDLKTCDPVHVLKKGRIVTSESFKPAPEPDPRFLETVKCSALQPADLQISYNERGFTAIRVQENTLLTSAEQVSPPRYGNIVTADPDQDLLKAAVIERHGKGGGVGLGFVRGFGFKKGAIACSVGHDDHNITAIGTNDEDISFAINRLRDLQGGYVVVENEKVLAELALPVAGLMSDQDNQSVTLREQAVRRAASQLGGSLKQPFILAAFLALSVIPDARLTDKGLTRNDGTGPQLEAGF